MRGKWIKMKRYHPNRHIHLKTPPLQVTIKLWIIELCAMKSKIPFSGMRAKNIARNTAAFPLLRQKKIKNFLTLLRGKSDYPPHRSIIQVCTVYRCWWLVSTPGPGITPSPNNGIRTFKSAMSIMSGNDSYKPRNSENGVDQVGRCRMITRFHFALEIRGSARYLSGIKDYSPAGEESSDDSSLVMDRLCDRARGQNTAVGWFYFEFPGRKEHSATSMLGSFLKHDGFLAEWNGFWGQEQRRAISGCGPQLVVCCTRVRYLYGTMLGYIDDDQKIGSPRCRYRKFHRYPLGGLKH